MTIGRLFLLFGSICVAIVVLTHIAEAFHIFPGMGWGRPNSIGHYLDLASAVLGCTLLLLGCLALFLVNRKRWG